ncbi:SRPBCC family protein [Sphingobium aquiterrae]|uniref:SRPBCC family protein n=1 Tax=Sphingobium aquiterrae TaxID=2038656 RepID=UPI003019C79A
MRQWLGALLLIPAVAAIAPAAAQDHVVIRHEVAVARPADAVWKAIGDYCAIRDWMQTDCDYARGHGEVGTIRRIRNHSTSEVMVASTAHSYTYWQTVGNMAPYDYHGTLAVEPDGPNRARLSYTLFYDQAAMPSDAVRASEHARIDKRFADLLGVMKTMAEARQADVK